MQHIIRKQIIELSLDKGLDAFSIQQRVSNYYFEKMVPLLQEAFDAVSSDQEIISIDTLEVDLGTIHIKEIEKGNWEKMNFKKISEQFVPVIHGLHSGIKVKKEPRSVSISDQWLFYMKHGYLPWNVVLINDDWYHSTLEAFATDAAAINNLRNLIAGHPDSVRRMVFQNSVPFLKSLIETLTAQNQDALPGFINEIAGFISSKDAKQKLWMQTLELAASPDAKLKSSEFVGLLVSNNFSIKQLKSEKIKKLLQKHGIDKDSIKKRSNEKEKETIKKEDKIRMNEDGIYVSNAGIVLLHPFLNLFFKNLHLVEGNDFINTQSQMKALYLLHYMATGNAHPQEHELVIAKVLCSFSLENPVDNLIELTDEEMEESKNLMLSAIGQWEILKGTSPDGLREGFLRRKGKLFTKNDNLVLQVEQSSIDMLLDHLPWNLSMIQLPWMKEMLRVEWR